LEVDSLTIPPGKNQSKVGRAMHTSGDAFKGIANGKTGCRGKTGRKWLAEQTSPSIQWVKQSIN
jgi:hypothetical protein